MEKIDQQEDLHNRGIMHNPVTPLRRTISELVEHDLIQFGIKIINQFSSLEEGNFDCWGYAFGNDTVGNREGLAEFPSMYKQVSKPRDGDIVLYSDDNHEMQHVGISVSRIRVYSKWGMGCVLEHRIREVPLAYGEYITFWRRVPYESNVRTKGEKVIKADESET